MQGSRAVMRTARRTFGGDAAVMYSRACYRGDRYSVFVPLREARPTLVPRTRSTDPGTDAGRAVQPSAPPGRIPEGSPR
ncbi:hypothetical protein ACFWEK_08875, partial [Isoptericola sp. NPDC060257]